MSCIQRHPGPWLLGGPHQSPCVTLGPEDLLCLCFCDPPLPIARKCSSFGGGYLRAEFQSSVGSWFGAHLDSSWGAGGPVLQGLVVVSPSFLGVVGNCPPISSSRHGASCMSEHMCWNQLSEGPLLSLCSCPSICTKPYTCLFQSVSAPPAG